MIGEPEKASAKIFVSFRHSQARMWGESATERPQEATVALPMESPQQTRI